MGDSVQLKSGGSAREGGMGSTLAMMKSKRMLQPALRRPGRSLCLTCFSNRWSIALLVVGKKAQFISAPLDLPTSKASHCAYVMSDHSQTRPKVHAPRRSSPGIQHKSATRPSTRVQQRRRSRSIQGSPLPPIMGIQGLLPLLKDIQVRCTGDEPIS